MHLTITCILAAAPASFMADVEAKLAAAAGEAAAGSSSDDEWVSVREEDTVSDAGDDAPDAGADA